MLLWKGQRPSILAHPITEMPAIPPNSLVVVTGITGYVASHIGLTALQAGHRVRGTVRSLARGEEVKAAYAKLGADVDKLEFVVVDDLTSQAQMENAIKGADGFIHVALPGSVPGDSDERPQEAIDSALAVLRAAAGEPSVKRVVFTSSSVAVIAPPDFKDKTLTDQDWNDEGAESYAATKEEDKNGFGWVNLRYAAMKTLSEKAAWKWVSEEKVCISHAIRSSEPFSDQTLHLQPAFDVVSILPNVNFGPVLFGGPRTTVSWIYSLLHNDGTWASMIPPRAYP